MTRPRTGFPFLDAGLDQPGSVLAFAHRGGAYHPEIEGLENTMAAFRHAVDLGYAYLETDVHATRDGVLVAFHDAVLDRVTAHRGPIADLDAVALGQALIGERERIPTMAALLEEFPGVRFNIDLKSEAAVPLLADLIDRTGSHDRVCVGSFSLRRTNRFRALVSDRVPTAASPVDVAVLRAVPSARVADVLLRRRPVALQIPRRRRNLTVLTPDLVERAHELGAHVHVWTVDDPEEMHELLDLGIDGLMTDRTDLLRQVLLERGQWMGAPR